ncbi:MAG: hypothetical protein ACR2LQ_01520 [Acidimicrobiales bacterium]
MLTTGSKYYFGLAAASVVGALVYGYGTGGGSLGVLTLGFYGGAGEHVGFIVLLFGAAATLFLGGVVVATRDADADQVLAVSGLDALPAVPAASGASYWPAIGALGAAIAVTGLVVNTQLFLLGVIVAIVTLFEWMVSAWSERATGDAETNRKVRNRLMYPVEVPVFGAFGIFFLVLSVSRVLLALPKSGSAIAAIVVAVLILATASILSFAPRAGRTVLAAVCTVGALGVLAGGIVSAAHGERSFGGEEHEVQYTPPDRGQAPANALPEQLGTAPEPETSSSK